MKFLQFCAAIFVCFSFSAVAEEAPAPEAASQPVEASEPERPAAIKPIELPTIKIGDEDKIKAEEIPNLPSVHVDDPLVDHIWLAERYLHPDLVILDVRDYERFAKGHIVGAVNMPASLTMDQKKRLAPVNVIATLLSEAGVTQEKTVVVYGDIDYINAARVYWVLKTLGLENVALLDGGMAYWMRKRRPWTKDTVTPSPKIFMPELTEAYRATAKQVMKADRVQLVDARRERFYLAADKTSKFPGHIANAFSIPWNKNMAYLRGSLRMRQPKALLGLYGLLKPFKPVVVYDENGKDAALVFFNLTRLGYEDVKVLDGGLHEWQTAGGKIVRPRINLKNNFGY